MSPTISDWTAALESDQALLAGLERIAKQKGYDKMRQQAINAARLRIQEAKAEVTRLSGAAIRKN